MDERADTVRTQLARLRTKYGLALPGKVSGIEAALGTFLAGPWEEQACAAAYRQIHSLAGSSGTYGYPEISGAARAAEAILKQCLEARALLSAALKGQVDDLIAKLRELAADAASRASA